MRHRPSVDHLSASNVSLELTEDIKIRNAPVFSNILPRSDAPPSSALNQAVREKSKRSFIVEFAVTATTSSVWSKSNAPPFPCLPAAHLGSSASTAEAPPNMPSLFASDPSFNIWPAPSSKLQ